MTALLSKREPVQTCIGASRNGGNGKGKGKGKVKGMGRGSSGKDAYSSDKRTAADAGVDVDVGDKGKMRDINEAYVERQLRATNGDGHNYLSYLVDKGSAATADAFLAAVAAAAKDEPR
jgi:hypothetical protein